MASWFNVVFGDFVLVVGFVGKLFLDTAVAARYLRNSRFVAGCASQAIVTGDKASSEESFNAVAEPDYLAVFDRSNVDDAAVAEALVDGPAASGSLLTSAVLMRRHPFAIAVEVGGRNRSIHDLVVAVEQNDFLGVLVRLN